MAPVLSVRGLNKSFGERTVVEDVDFDVVPGELVAVLGANGSGKSTVLRCIMGLIEPDAGSITLSGQRLDLLHAGALREARRAAAMVFQQVHLVPRLSVLTNVCTGGLSRVSGARGLSPLLFPRELKEEAMVCLDRVGLADRALDRAGSLSGGQQQRVAIARALCQRSTVVLADEPVSALDPHAADTVMSLLRELAHDEGLGVIAVLHQPDLARRYADRVIGLLSGRVAVRAERDELTDERLDLLYLPDRAPVDAAQIQPASAGGPR